MREWLKDLRMKKGLSKSDMAAKLKISRQYYGYIESGERQPSLDFNLATQISDILKVSLNKIRECEESRVRQ